MGLISPNPPLVLRYFPEKEISRFDQRPGVEINRDVFNSAAGRINSHLSSGYGPKIEDDARYISRDSKDHGTELTFYLDGGVVILGRAITIIHETESGLENLTGKLGLPKSNPIPQEDYVVRR
ncbi:hypothetical protein J4423_01010 [Candidatus Pacearchaeota archaeon]|nr:hypothetical protein [Candidatus Pacearchaeota archaeon]